MLEIKGIIIVFPIGNTEISACAEYALAHYVEYVYGWRLIACSREIKVCFIHDIVY